MDHEIGEITVIGEFEPGQKVKIRPGRRYDWHWSTTSDDTQNTTDLAGGGKRMKVQNRCRTTPRVVRNRDGLIAPP